MKVALPADDVRPVGVRRVALPGQARLPAIRMVHTNQAARFLRRADTGPVLASVYMFVLGVGIGASMQVLVIAVQNAVGYADLGAATSGASACSHASASRVAQARRNG